MVMTARPPPTRPHLIHPTSSSFTTHSITESWVEDDAWDSASDSESPRRSTFASPWVSRSTSSFTSPTGTTTTAPKPVPRPTKQSSSSTLASSYTHLNAPNPSSYPPRPEYLQQPSQQGWTIVRKSSDEKTRISLTGQDSRIASGEVGCQDQLPGPQSHGVDDDVEGDIIVNDLDGVEDMDMPIMPPKPRLDQGIVREDAEQIVEDPLYAVSKRMARRIDKSPSPSRVQSPERTEKLRRERSMRTNRRHKFLECLSSEDVNIAELRKLGWAGIPAELRPLAWKLLLGYVPLPSPLRSSTLARKRGEYLSLVEVAFSRDREGLDQQIWHQIEIDVPRTRPGVKLWMQRSTQRSLERILYVWAIRHPASGYVQGINDLVTPFFQVFLSAYIDSDPEEFDPAILPESVLNAIEADSFWCLSRLLDGIQDNYISGQPGIQRSVRRMAELVSRTDAPLYAHLEAENVEFMQFAFRWMNCLLMREISVQNTIRMWDTYLSEGPDAFSQFHLYVCSAFLVKWSDKLRQMDFQGIIMFLQSLPTQTWNDHEIELLLSEAFVLNSVWQNAQSHFGVGGK